MLTSVALSSDVTAERLLYPCHPQCLDKRRGGVYEGMLGFRELTLLLAATADRSATAADNDEPSTRASRGEGNVWSRAAGRELMNTVVQVGAFRQNKHNTGHNQMRRIPF